MGVTFIAKEGTYTAPATLTSKTITENGTYSAVDDSANGYSSVTVEVEGGGGSSDFSTAEVIFNNSATGYEYKLLANAFVCIDNNTIGINTEAFVTSQRTFEIVVYKGSQFIPLNKFTDYDNQTMPVVTGAIEFVTSPSYGFMVSGDGSITAKGTSRVD